MIKYNILGIYIRFFYDGIPYELDDIMKEDEYQKYIDVNEILFNYIPDLIDIYNFKTEQEYFDHIYNQIKDYFLIVLFF